MQRRKEILQNNIDLFEKRLVDPSYKAEETQQSLKQSIEDAKIKLSLLGFFYTNPKKKPKTCH